VINTSGWHHDQVTAAFMFPQRAAGGGCRAGCGIAGCVEVVMGLPEPANVNGSPRETGYEAPMHDHCDWPTGEEWSSPIMRPARSST
jgi:hypothetical protein